MVLLAKIGSSLLLLFVCAALIYPTAYAFAVDYTLKTWLQYLQMALAVAGLACIWADWPPGAFAGLLGVLLITAIILLVNRRAPAPPPPDRP